MRRLRRAADNPHVHRLRTGGQTLRTRSVRTLRATPTYPRAAMRRGHVHPARAGRGLRRDHRHPHPAHRTELAPGRCWRCRPGRPRRRHHTDQPCRPRRPPPPARRRLPATRPRRGHPRTQLLVATRFLTWLEHSGVTMAQCHQGDVDTWLANGPAGYPVRDFLGWAAEHHHCPALLVPALGRTTGTATDADERWALIARLLHDNTLELTDRVAGAFLLCYGQQLSRITVMRTEQVHRHGDVVSLRFGAHDLTVPEPLSGLITDLIEVGRHHLGVGSPSTSPWLFPGHLPGRPITPARLGERLR